MWESWDEVPGRLPADQTAWLTNATLTKRWLEGLEEAKTQLTGFEMSPGQMQCTVGCLGGGTDHGTTIVFLQVQTTYTATTIRTTVLPTRATMTRTRATTATTFNDSGDESDDIPLAQVTMFRMGKEAVSREHEDSDPAVRPKVCLRVWVRNQKRHIHEAHEATIIVQLLKGEKLSADRTVRYMDTSNSAGCAKQPDLDLRNGEWEVSLGSTVAVLFVAPARNMYRRGAVMENYVYPARIERIRKARSGTYSTMIQRGG